MARFDVYANPDVAERRNTPFFVDIQNDYISQLGTRVVIPLRREALFGPRARNLNPMLTVGSDNLVLDTSALGTVPSSELHRPAANLRDARATIQEALETLFGAY